MLSAWPNRRIDELLPTSQADIDLPRSQTGWLIDKRLDLLDPGMSRVRMLRLSFWRNCNP
jgi:hypothetical protein